MKKRGRYAKAFKLEAVRLYNKIGTAPIYLDS